MKLTALLLAVLVAIASPATANQWVKGNVEIVEDYSAFSAQGLLITLTNLHWGGGSQADGATACYGRFSVLVGQQNVTSDLFTRMYATLLTAKAVGSQIALFVDTSTGPECRVQIVSYGRTAI